MVIGRCRKLKGWSSANMQIADRHTHTHLEADVCVTAVDDGDELIGGAPQFMLLCGG